ncbi:MAG: DUF2007 domain-containing protein [Bdellovibrio sp.]|nr:DUF2007 domain-containing protein [Bdellovibrio sp.]
MKLISKFSSQLEAQIVSQSLIARGIRCEVHGAKEYSSFVVGGDLGSFELFVEEDKYNEAFEIIRAQRVTAAPTEQIHHEPKSYLKKAVIFSLLAAVMIPVVFNYVAFVNLKAYLTTEPNPGKRIWAFIFVLLLQIPTILILGLIIKNYA